MEMRRSQMEEQRRSEEAAKTAAELRALRQAKEQLELALQKARLTAEEQEGHRKRQAELQAQERELERRRQEEAEEQERRKREETERQFQQQREELSAQAELLKALPDSAPPALGAASDSSSSSSSGGGGLGVTAPKVSIFRVRPQSPDEREEVDLIYQLFIAQGVHPSDIQVADLMTEPELLNWVRGKMKLAAEASPPSPTVFIYENAIGAVREVVDLFKDPDTVNTLLSTPPTEDVQSVGVIGAVLNASEYVGSLLTSWWRSSPAPLPEGVDFQVVHQNWYYRNLYRIFRFTDSAILRIHPNSMTLRATHPYSTIQYVAAIDPHNIVINYSDNSPPDYIRASAHQIHAMKVLINEKSKGTVRIVTP